MTASRWINLRNSGVKKGPAEILVWRKDQIIKIYNEALSR